MSREVLLDTNGWFALLNADDSILAEAKLVWPEINRDRRPVVLTDWIIAETGNGLARYKRAIGFAEAVARIHSSRQFEVVYVGPELLRLALDIYSTRLDKSWGLVDCASFALMQERGITDAFTNDRHFLQAGFNCLLAGAT